ncbi:beta-N-acetylhexosaminidase [Myxococcota bacterium]|nr:beta-N-acetylhexosaminidase [Myxococcota bacterium]MBU1381286.1 beta-N-acetylhexosaminidase [Myxococcota bacterium]MBU1495999.1 beta-N-acetylhexosaminidase [Myxococcota bacterium]
MKNTSPGNLIWAGFEGRTVPDYIRVRLQSGELGGIIIFSRNFTSPQTLRNLTDDLRSHWNGVGALPIAIDQEGGKVRRLSWVNWPSAYSLSHLENDQHIFDIGAAMGDELSQMGINIDFAPVLDLYNPDSIVLGDRCFSHDVDVIVKNASSWIDGIKTSQIAVCGKHFPGHGSVNADSHLEKPVCHLSAEEIDIHMRPFKLLLDKLDLIMVAHVLYENLDGNSVATFSPIIMDIPHQWGFSGLLLSDDLEMGALKELDAMEIAFRSIVAGLDSLIVCRSENMFIKTLEALDKVCTSSSETSLKIQSGIQKVLTWRNRLRNSYPEFSESNFNKLISDNNYMLEKIMG